MGCRCTASGPSGASPVRRWIGARPADPRTAVVPHAADVPPLRPAGVGGRSSGFAGVPVVTAGDRRPAGLAYLAGRSASMARPAWRVLGGVGGLSASGLSPSPRTAFGGRLVCSTLYPHHCLRCGAPGRLSACCRCVHVVDESVTVVAVAEALSVVDRRPPRRLRPVDSVLADPLHRVGISHGFPFEIVFAFGFGKGTAPGTCPVTTMPTDPRAGPDDRHWARTRVYVPTSRCALVTGHLRLSTKSLTASKNGERATRSVWSLTPNFLAFVREPGPDPGHGPNPESLANREHAA